MLRQECVRNSLNVKFWFRDTRTVARLLIRSQNSRKKLKKAFIDLKRNDRLIECGSKKKHRVFDKIMLAVFLLVVFVYTVKFLMGFF